MLQVILLINDLKLEIIFFLFFIRIRLINRVHILNILLVNFYNPIKINE